MNGQTDRQVNTNVWKDKILYKSTRSKNSIVMQQCIEYCCLNHCGLVTPYGDRDLGQHFSGNGLLPAGTKPLPEPMLTDHQ